MPTQNELVGTYGADRHDVSQVKPGDAVFYVMDLLGELQEISKFGGMDALSEDIAAVIAKHLP
jgi:hypothetical protein